jgi:hypothetical protein
VGHVEGAQLQEGGQVLQHMDAVLTQVQRRQPTLREWRVGSGEWGEECGVC